MGQELSCATVRKAPVHIEAGLDKMCDRLEDAAIAVEDAIDDAIDRATMRPPTSVRCMLSDREVQQVDELFWSLADASASPPVIVAGEPLLLALRECGFTLPMADAAVGEGGTVGAALRALHAMPAGHWRQQGERGFTLEQFRELVPRPLNCAEPAPSCAPADPPPARAAGAAAAAAAAAAPVHAAGERAAARRGAAAAARRGRAARRMRQPLGARPDGARHSTP